MPTWYECKKMRPDFKIWEEGDRVLGGSVLCASWTEEDGAVKYFESSGMEESRIDFIARCHSAILLSNEEATDS